MGYCCSHQSEGRSCPEQHLCLRLNPLPDEQVIGKRAAANSDELVMADA